MDGYISSMYAVGGVKWYGTKMLLAEEVTAAAVLYNVERSSNYETVKQLYKLFVGFKIKELLLRLQYQTIIAVRFA